MELTLTSRNSQRPETLPRESSPYRAALVPGTGTATVELLGMTLVEVDLEGDARRKLCSPAGVAVLVADRGREAFRGGVRSGDLIAEINSTKIRTIKELQQLLRHHDPHQPLFVFLLNSGGWRFTNLSFVS